MNVIFVLILSIKNIRAALRSANIYGFMFGLTSSVSFYAVAASFNLGAFIIEKQLFGIKFEDIMMVFSVLLFGAQAVGESY